MANSNDIVLQTVDLTKVFPGTVAVNKANFDVRKNEVHAIMGENGAGKSTVCKMLTGLYAPDGGEIYFMGDKIEFGSTADAMSKGVNMVYQERNLISFLTGAQNIMLGTEPVRGKFFLDEAELRRQAEVLKDRLGLDVPLDTPVEDLSAGIQQSIEIVRAFSTRPKLLILDEPTASLSEREIVPFLSFIQDIKKTQDISIIFISHKLDEVFQIADRITVFTEGNLVLTANKSETTKEECISAMLKTGNPDPIVVNKTVENPKRLLEVGTCVYDRKEHKLNFHVDEGEVVGFYGLVGAGRTECANAIFGLSLMEESEVKLNGEVITDFSTHKMIENGLIMTPELRAHGMFESGSLVDNIGILFLPQFTSKLGIIDDKAKDEFAKEILKVSGVRYADPHQSIDDLSGGNKQKIIIGRSVALENISVLILDEPTNGLDLGAKHDVYLKARSIAEEQGKGVIFITSEIDEVLSVCDRLYVFAEGHVVAEFKRSEFDKQIILSAAFRRVNDGIDSEKAV